MEWGAGYTWDSIRELLEQLLEEEILRLGSAPADAAAETGTVASSLPASRCPVSRVWSEDQCDPIMRDLTGRGVELGHLESIVPFSRIAHPALDADGRQLGEGNVWPMHLRMDIPTEWRVCQYAGSRYLDECPMNATALKAMIKHWKPMMVALQKIRGDFRKRLGRSDEPLTLLELNAYANAVLAVPTYALMRRDSPVASGSVHPVLSSMFRITDGIRMVAMDMLFSSKIKLYPHDTAITGEMLYDHAERTNMFLSAHGVCAGPKALIDEFMTVVVDGRLAFDAETVTPPAEVRDALATLPDAFDYALLSLKVWTITCMLWTEMIRSYRRIHAVIESVPAEAESVFGRFRARLREERPWERPHVEHPSDYLRPGELLYATIYDQTRRGVRRPAGPATLAECVDPSSTVVRAGTTERLRDLFARRFSRTPAVTAETVDALAVVLTDYYRQEQAVLNAVAEAQGEVNALLGRPSPKQLLAGGDLHIVYGLREGLHNPLPYLGAALEQTLDVSLENTRDGLDIVEPRVA